MMTLLQELAMTGTTVVVVYCIIFMVIGIRSQASRAVLLHLLAFCQGVNLRWVIDPALAFQILKVSDKGDLIESKLSLPAWRPVISLESVNGEQWRRMKTQFTKLTQVLQPISELTNLFETRGRELLGFETVIDALKWVFERKFDSQKFAEVCHSTWEWRKQIVLKGFADGGVKERTVEWCVEEIRCTPRLYELFGAKWAEPEYYSLILQPFIISPAINLTDVTVVIKEWVNVTPATELITPEIIRQCVCTVVLIRSQSLSGIALLAMLN
ncbi:hypothetical protein PHMEG_00011022 [Phytophthora megakarya]|uniref:Uncharacterized protein n=1 Tax=Phytophthora megakarya TaxID=4795 RepID=A0A225WE91_9STRA|nr:hypothetical protein PHMEG_00011022 [Phytophthora megakarya]